MKIAVVLNEGGGTLKRLELAVVVARIEEVLGEAGHTLVPYPTGAPDLKARLAAAIAARPDAVVVGGGDGTVSLAASMLAQTDIALGVLPLGTMNLYARTLGGPLEFEGALAALAGATVRPADIAAVNGRPFLHHVSFGLHPDVVRRREEGHYRSAFSKRLASIRAFIATARRVPHLDFDIGIDARRRHIAATALVVSNNLYRGQHLPYADDPADGRLGVYWSDAERFGELLVLATELAIGDWRDNPTVEAEAGTRVEIRSRRRGAILVSIDGELERLSAPLVFTKRHNALRVLMPAKSDAAAEAGRLDAATP